jgi:hypothetical protein
MSRGGTAYHFKISAASIETLQHTIISVVLVVSTRSQQDHYLR